jgi:hypothetical protein
LLASFLAVPPALATGQPVTYTGFTISDGQLGTWQFHNARVTFTFLGNTSNVQEISAGGADISINTTGTAKVLIAAPGRTVGATFAPDQLFVSLDHGTPDPCCPSVGGRGLGFGSFTATHDFDPAYPLGVEDGTIDWGDPLSVSPGV